jgi:hypothetical protein
MPVTVTVWLARLKAAVAPLMTQAAHAITSMATVGRLRQRNLCAQHPCLMGL